MYIYTHLYTYTCNPPQWWYMWAQRTRRGLKPKLYKLPRPWSIWWSSPARENSHGRSGNRARDLMVSSEKLWPPNHDGGHTCKCIDVYTKNQIPSSIKLQFIFSLIYLSDYDTTTNISRLNTSSQNENLRSNLKNNKGKAERYYLVSCMWSMEVSSRDLVHWIIVLLWMATVSIQIPVPVFMLWRQSNFRSH
jgi:hypothetical protein